MVTTIEVGFAALVQLATSEMRGLLFICGSLSPEVTCSVVQEKLGDSELSNLFDEEFLLRLWRICNIRLRQLNRHDCSEASRTSTNDISPMHFRSTQFARRMTWDSGRASRKDAEASGAIDCDKHIITLCYTPEKLELSILLHFMCHAAHPGSDDLDKGWLAEMDRLRSEGGSC